MNPAGTSNELDVQNEWEESTHTYYTIYYWYFVGMRDKESISDMKSLKNEGIKNQQAPLLAAEKDYTVQFESSIVVVKAAQQHTHKTLCMYVHGIQHPRRPSAYTVASIGDTRHYHYL